MPPRKSLLERVFQAVLFESLAVVLSTLVFAWVMHVGWADMGALSLANSLIAMVWNVVFNAGFDRARRRFDFTMTFIARASHSIGFECGMLLLSLPIGMWWLRLGFLPALAFESGAMLFFLIYTYVYHWGYDCLRDQVVNRRGEVPGR